MQTLTARRENQVLTLIISVEPFIALHYASDPKQFFGVLPCKRKAFTTLKTSMMPAASGLLLR
jgi:hypothetical protein